MQLLTIVFKLLNFGFHLITFFNENGEVDIYKWLNELELVADKNKPLILICRSGRRTGIVSDYLDKYFEFFNFHNLDSYYHFLNITCIN